MSELPENVGEVAHQTIIEFRKIFDKRFFSAYAIGSIAHGGFSPAVSDIDLAVVLNGREESDSGNVEKIQKKIIRSGLRLAPRISIFWTSLQAMKSGKPDGRLPYGDYVDLIEYGQLLAGCDVIEGLPKPETSEVILDGARFALFRLASTEVVREVKNPSLLTNDISRLVKICLMPIRMLYNLETGLLGITENAVRHYLSSPRAPSCELVRIAYLYRRSPESVNIDELILLASKQLRKIYYSYIDSQVEWLKGRDAKIMSDFLAWRSSLA